MTVIVGLIDKQCTYIGADSGGVSGFHVRRRADAKVFRKGDMVIGYTSSFRMGQLLRFNLTLPEHSTRKDDYEYLATDFIDAVRVCLKTGGYAKIDNSREEGGTFVVAYHGKLFTIEDDLQVGQVLDSYTAEGCGREYALGAFHATIDGDAESRVRAALSAAEYFSAAVAPPFIVEHIDHAAQS